MDFLLVIELFSLGVMAEAVRANIDWKSPFLKGIGHLGPKYFR